MKTEHKNNSKQVLERSNCVQVLSVNRGGKVMVKKGVLGVGGGQRG